MGRSALACRAHLDAADEQDVRLQRLEAQNASLREQVAEVEAWYRLLQAEHEGHRAEVGRRGREATELRTALNRLEAENADLRARLDRRESAEVGAASAPNEDPNEGASPMRIATVVQKLKAHRWALTALGAVLALAARDPWVRGLAASGLDRLQGAARQTAERASGEDGFLRYAAVVQAREALDRARADYNEREASLKGDALLEAQDRLRASKSRYRSARLAFLPELARRCSAARVELPKEAALALAELKAEASE